MLFQPLHIKQVKKNISIKSTHWIARTSVTQESQQWTTTPYMNWILEKLSTFGVVFLEYAFHSPLLVQQLPVPRNETVSKPVNTMCKAAVIPDLKGTPHVWGHMPCVTVLRLSLFTPAKGQASYCSALFCVIIIMGSKNAIGVTPPVDASVPRSVQERQSWRQIPAAIICLKATSNTRLLTCDGLDSGLSGSETLSHEFLVGRQGGQQKWQLFPDSFKTWVRRQPPGLWKQSLHSPGGNWESIFNDNRGKRLNPSEWVKEQGSAWQSEQVLEILGLEIFRWSMWEGAVSTWLKTTIAPAFTKSKWKSIKQHNHISRWYFVIYIYKKKNFESAADWVGQTTLLDFRAAVKLKCWTVWKCLMSSWVDWDAEITTIWSSLQK